MWFRAVTFWTDLEKRKSDCVADKKPPALIFGVSVIFDVIPKSTLLGHVQEVLDQSAAPSHKTRR